MGVSAVGARGIRPRTVPVLLFTTLGVLMALMYAVGPAILPGMRSAAEEKCNLLTGANGRSYRLEWIVPKSATWDPPHWLCKDARDLNKPGVDFGWWVSPF